MAGVVEPKKGLRVLSLDGPPFAVAAAALSEPLFLQQIAYRWSYNEEDEDEIDGNAVRVSDMFDIIAGCGIGGLYAILFARLNMTIGQGITFHHTLRENLFTNKCWSQTDHQECMRAFSDALDQAVHQSGIMVDLDSSFFSKDCKKCYIVVLNVETETTHLPRALRSYKVRTGPSPRCTIRQALNATLADLEHFPAVSIGDESFISGSGVFPNPARLLVKELSSAFPQSYLACFVSLGADCTHPKNDSRLVSQDLISQFRDLGCFFRLSLNDELHAESRIMPLVMGYFQEEDISEIADKIVEAVKACTPVVNVLRLGNLAGEDGRNELRRDVSHIRNEEEIKRAREKLCGSFDFRPIHEHGCLPGTREDVLQSIEAWAEDDNAPNIFWLEGYPGTGKTAISISLKQRLAEAGRLGASCFFRREDVSHHSLSTLFRSIASQLLDSHDSIRGSIVKAVNSNVVKFEGAAATLFEQLIYDPLKTTRADVSQCVVVVLDALDEFGPSDADQLHLLTHLLKWTQLSPRCKLFLASRSQGPLPRHLDLPVHKIKRLEVGDRASTETFNDIRKFFDRSLEIFQNRFCPSTPLLTESELTRLVNASSGLFIWASTVIELLKQKALRTTAKQFLQKLCNQHITAKSTRMQPLYKLYRTVLSPLLESEGPHAEPSYEELWTKKAFFSAVVCARIPLSIKALSSLCRAKIDDILDIVQHLAPVMDSAYGLRFVHKSFVDYITSTDFPFPIEREATELAFTRSCFTIMHSQLHFNMGNMPSSYMLNSEVPTLHETLSEELRYASQFWGAHVTHLRKDEKYETTTLIKPIENFIDYQFLYWVEAVSILGCFREAMEALSNLQRAGICEAASCFAQDALAFLRQFSLPISQSYSHLYISAVPWAPTRSLIRAKYLDFVPNAPKIVSGGDETWPSQSAGIRSQIGKIKSLAFSPDGSRIAVAGVYRCIIEIWDAATCRPISDPLQRHNCEVTSIAFSPDSSELASGCEDGTIQIWATATLQPVGEPLRGHLGRVQSVAFSPNGSWIASGSSDRSIRIWDVAARQSVGKPLQLHDDTVTSIAFSPNGFQIVSGSYDKTIRIWDIATHHPVGEPLRGHIGKVKSVKFSPDGSRIFSWSDDRTVRTWDVATHQSIGKLLQGYSGVVDGVAFSPDGSQIVSASWDKAVQIWDAATGQTIGKPLRGHTESVRSVAFSPDGSQIISGGDDFTIRIWDAAAPQFFSEPFHGHTDFIHSVCFSPDGSRIISGSDDSTIRIWDAATRQIVGQPLQGHHDDEGWVLSVAFSPDGSQIVSGSWDTTVRIWDTATCQAVGEPLRGHTGPVYSAAFSPDGSQIISGSSDNTIRIWDVTTRQLAGTPIQCDYDAANHVVFSPNGSYIVSAGSFDCTIRIWDSGYRLEVGQPLQGHDGKVSTVACSPDGSQIVSGSKDETIRIWDVATHQPIGEPLRGHKGSVRSVSFSPDSTQIVSCSEDGTVRIWDIANHHQPMGRVLRGHLDNVKSVTFSPDGSQIVSGSYDKTIRIWDVAAHQPVKKPVKGSKRLSFSRTSNPSPLYCFLLEDGWVIDQHNRRLVWVPQHLHEFLPTPGLVDIIGTRRMVVVDASNLRTGTEWSSCVGTN